MTAEYGDLEYDDIVTLVARAEPLLVDEIRAADVSPVAKTPLKALVAAHCALRRNLELTRAFAVSFNSRLLIPLFVIARAAVETGSLIFDMYAKTAEMLDAGDTKGFEDYEQRLMKVLLGSKSNAAAGDPEMYQALNVLTVIDRLDRTSNEGLREMYDALSEYAHPNYAGLLESYTEPHPEEQMTEFLNDPLAQRIDLLHVAFNLLAVGLSMSILTVEQLQSRAEELAVFCESVIYERGTWPSALPYPLPRPEQA